MKQFTKEQAMKFYQSREWKDFTDEEIVKLQLYQDRACIEFSRFHTAMNNVLGRSVFVHEFADTEALKAEYEGRRPSPTWDEIINLIPEDKRIIFTGA